MKTNRHLYGGLLVLALSAALLLYFRPLASNNRATASSSATSIATVLQSVEQSSDERTLGATQVLSKEGRLKTPAAVVESPWAAGFYSRDPYPEVLALRSLHRAGAFAAASAITSACVRGLVAIQSTSLANAVNASPDPQGRRIAARNEIEQRCIRFNTLEAMRMMTQPEFGDEAGLRFARAAEVLRERPRDKAALEDAINEVIAQGRFDLLRGVISESFRWRGQDWSDRREVFDAAVAMASWRFTSVPGHKEADIRLLTACYTVGQCDSGTFATGGLNDAQRAVADALAEDMLNAFRQADRTAVR